MSLEMMFLVVLEFLVFRYFTAFSIQKLLNSCEIFLIYIFYSCYKLRYFFVSLCTCVILALVQEQISLYRYLLCFKFN